jgi:hypothetical protein
MRCKEGKEKREGSGEDKMVDLCNLLLCDVQVYRLCLRLMNSLLSGDKSVWSPRILAVRNDEYWDKRLQNVVVPSLTTVSSAVVYLSLNEKNDYTRIVLNWQDVAAVLHSAYGENV